MRRRGQADSGKLELTLFCPHKISHTVSTKLTLSCFNASLHRSSNGLRVERSGVTSCPSKNPAKPPGAWAPRGFFPPRLGTCAICGCDSRHSRRARVVFFRPRRGHGACPELLGPRSGVFLAKTRPLWSGRAKEKKKKKNIKTHEKPGHWISPQCRPISHPSFKTGPERDQRHPRVVLVRALFLFFGAPRRPGAAKGRGPLGLSSRKKSRGAEARTPSWGRSWPRRAGEWARRPSCGTEAVWGVGLVSSGGVSSRPEKKDKTSAPTDLFLAPDFEIWQQQPGLPRGLRGGPQEWAAKVRPARVWCLCSIGMRLFPGKERE